MAEDSAQQVKIFVKQWFNESESRLKLITDAVLSKQRRILISIHLFHEEWPELGKLMMCQPFLYFAPLEESIQELYLSYTTAPIKGSVKVGFTDWIGGQSVTPRGLNSVLVNKMVAVSGIVTNISQVKPKLKKSVNVIDETARVETRVHEDSASLKRDRFQIVINPKKDGEGRPFKMEYGLNEYEDFQRFTIQELPEKTPSGQLPRAITVIAEDNLTNLVKAGDRIQVFGIYRCFISKENGVLTGYTKGYIIANNIKQLKEQITLDSIKDYELKKIQKFAHRDDTLSFISKAVAPSIYGRDDIKKGLLLQLIGGVCATKSDGMQTRGDIHILLIGDASCGKSQLLRFILNNAPLALSTSGRGSSGVGLTAAVVNDKDTGDRKLEPGAMILGDGGIVCIDEFDKMNSVDRVAIHEVMEQQTVSICKAGIHMTINARCSILAAANPVYGGFDDTVDLRKQICFPDSLLSRFDLIFIVRDTATAQEDRNICTQILKQFRTAFDDSDDFMYFDLPVTENKPNKRSVWEFANTKGTGKMLNNEFLRKYIFYVKKTIPIVIFTEDAKRKLIEVYVKLRQKMSRQEGSRGSGISSVPTTRVLESLMRLSTAHARLKLRDQILEEDALEASNLICISLGTSLSDLLIDTENTQTKNVAKKVKISNTQESVPKLDSDERKKLLIKVLVSVQEDLLVEALPKLELFEKVNLMLTESEVKFEMKEYLKLLQQIEEENKIM